MQAGGTDFNWHFMMRRVAFAFLVLFVFAIPWEDSLVIGNLGTISRLLGLFAFGLGLASLFVRDGVVVRSPSLFVIAAAGFLLWMTSSLLWTVDRTLSIPYVLTLIQLVGMSWLIWQQCKTEASRELLLRAYVIGSIVSVGNTFYQFALGSTIAGSSAERYAAVGFNANYLASTLALAIPMAWYLFATARRPFAMAVNLAAIPLILVAIVMTGSRGGVIAAVAALLVIPLTAFRLRPLAQGLVVVSLVGVAGTSYYFAPEFERLLPDNLQRIAEISDQVSSGDLTGRGEIWLAGWQAFTNRPLLGYGAGAFEAAVEPYLGTRLNAHNAFIGIAVEGGLVGLLMFLLILGLAYAPITRLPVVDRALYLTLVAVVLVTLIPSTLENGKQTWFVLTFVTTRIAFVLHPSSATTTRPIQGHRRIGKTVPTSQRVWRAQS